MAFEGDPMNESRVFSFKVTNAVVVSGVKVNPCGHLILNLGGSPGEYFHVSELYGYPLYMNEDGYQRYLKENGKKELRRWPVAITKEPEANAKLCDLMAKKWFWGVLPHNCAAFVETVVQAGGSKAGLYFNCPTAEAFR